ncbi:GntR family transcriptional regulator [Aurantimonas sp. 22II-16-19i]|uniref:GntR family transcriptional regulator n=1 Tax=Aurantimonas sp. 22II-16-19i TaxID=1317114 RepID=UPI0009F7A2AE|nr:GntR family transcriptional regulator [Aurantimonas sp. 22II-16-19i]ORE98907.1 GntR domain protein [Aurantimonas sp. 22II-16-19i]
MTSTAREKPGLRMADRVYEAIRREILDGRLAPGEKITEAVLAERFEASRTPVRSAIVRLAGDGFVDMTPRSGTVVKRRTPNEVSDIYEVRALLESAAAGLAAGRCDARDLGELQAIQGEMEAATAGYWQAEDEVVEKVSTLNQAFHQKILEASRNATLADSAARLMNIGFLINTYARFSRPEIERSLFEHRQLIAALTSRDPAWAEAVMRAHILGARNSLAAES